MLHSHEDECGNSQEPVSARPGGIIQTAMEESASRRTAARGEGAARGNLGKDFLRLSDTLTDREINCLQVHYCLKVYPEDCLYLQNCATAQRLPNDCERSSNSSHSINSSDSSDSCYFIYSSDRKKGQNSSNSSDSNNGSDICHISKTTSSNGSGYYSGDCWEQVCQIFYE